MSYVHKAKLDISNNLVESMELAGLTRDQCIELCDVGERTWYRWMDIGAPTWAIRLILSQRKMLDLCGWPNWEFRGGRLYCNDLHHRYYWEPVSLLLPLFNVGNSALPFENHADNLSSIEVARRAGADALRPADADVQPQTATPMTAYNTYYVKSTLDDYSDSNPSWTSQ